MKHGSLRRSVDTPTMERIRRKEEERLQRINQNAGIRSDSLDNLVLLSQAFNMMSNKRLNINDKYIDVNDCLKTP